MANQMTYVIDRVPVPKMLRAWQLRPRDSQDTRVFDRNDFNQVTVGIIIEKRWSSCKIFKCQIFIRHFGEMFNRVLLERVETMVADKAQRHYVC